MTSILQNEASLRRLGAWYLWASCLAVLAFFAALQREGYQADLALSCATGAALGYVLLRRAERLRMASVDDELVTSLMPLASFLLKVNELIDDVRPHPAVGLMLVRVTSPTEADKDAASLLAAVQRHLSGSDHPATAIDGETLAVVTRGEHSGPELEALSREILDVARGNRIASLRVPEAQVTVGIAVSETDETSAAQLYATARAAARLGASASHIVVRHT